VCRRQWVVLAAGTAARMLGSPVGAQQSEVNKLPLSYFDDQRKVQPLELRGMPKWAT
jgi:hypothetical protein